MTDLKSIQKELNRMVGMKFGSYNASIKNMDKEYSLTKKDYESITFNSKDEHEVRVYHDENGKHVATAAKNTKEKRIPFLMYNVNTDRTYQAAFKDTQISYSIYDHNTGRTYSTDRQDKNTASDKFKYIAFDGYAVTDTNGNGVIDGEDIVSNYASGLKPMKVKDILDGNF